MINVYELLDKWRDFDSEFRRLRVGPRMGFVSMNETAKRNFTQRPDADSRDIFSTHLDPELLMPTQVDCINNYAIAIIFFFSGKIRGFYSPFLSRVVYLMLWCS